MIKASFEASKAYSGRAGTVLLQKLFPDKEFLTSHGLELTWGCARPGMSVARHQHDDDGLFLFVRGRGVIQIGGEAEAVGPGDAVLAPAHLDHSILNDESNEEDLVWLGVRFTPGTDSIAR